MKSQRKQVRNLKKKSLWSRSLEEVDAVYFFNLNFIFFDGTFSIFPLL
ncbi:hypothetical protein Gotur_001326 [Gossypium turneri]